MGNKITMQCAVCKKSFPSKKQGMRHMETSHQKELYMKNVVIRQNALHK